MSDELRVVTDDSIPEHMITPDLSYDELTDILSAWFTYLYGTTEPDDA